MANWQDPRPLFPWSPATENQGQRMAPKLRPNLFARLARSAAQNALAVVLVSLFMLAAATTICLFALNVDFSRPEQLPKAQATAMHEFDMRFPTAGKHVTIRLASDTPEAALTAARTLAATLGKRTEDVESAIIPELDAAPAGFAPYYLDTPELNRRVEATIGAIPYYQLLAAAPTLSGLSGMLATAKGAAEAGSAPKGLADFLSALADSVANLAQGRADNLQWPRAIGLARPPQVPELTVLVLPRPGSSRSFQTALQTELAAVQADKPFLQASVEAPWAADQQQAELSSGRQFIVCFSLALLFLITLLSFIFKSPRNVALVILPASLGTLMALAASTFVQSPLDAAAAAIPLVIMPAAVGVTVCFVLALARHEKRAISTLSLIMLAAQQAGAAMAIMALMPCVLWLAWAIIGIGGLSLPVSAIVGHLAAAIASLLLLPALAALVPHGKPEFSPVAAAQSGRIAMPQNSVARIRPWVASAILALAFIAAMLFAYRLTVGENAAAEQPLHIQADSLKAASNIVTALRGEEAVGRINWVDDLLPPDVAAKRGILSRLASVTLPIAVAAPTAETELESQWQRLDEELRSLANLQGLDPALLESALRLRRSLSLLASGPGGTAGAVRKLEASLAGSMGQLQPYLQSVARLAPPGLDDMEPAVRALYVSSDGAYRIEAWPRSPVSQAEFSRVVLGVAPGSISAHLNAALASNQVRLGLAMAIPLGLGAMIMLAFLALRSIRSTAAFASSLIAYLALTAGVSLFVTTGSGLTLAAAALASLGAAGVTGLWVMLAGRETWVTPWGFLYGPIAGVAILVPILLLSIGEFQTMAVLLILNIGLMTLVHAVLTPQLRSWLGRHPQSPAASDASRTAAVWPRAKPTRQVSTSPASDANDSATSGADLPPASGEITGRIE